MNGCNGYPNECQSNMNESNSSFNLNYLTIDHIANDGAIDRKSKKNTRDIYNEIIELYEKGELNMIKKKYQPLCWNCNSTKGLDYKSENAYYNKLK